MQSSFSDTQLYSIRLIMMLNNKKSELNQGLNQEPIQSHIDSIKPTVMKTPENETGAHSKLTLVIDGNWLLMSRLIVIKDNFMDTTDLIRNLKRLLIKSINGILRQIPEIDNIIFVSDGGSWRNKLHIPSVLTEHGIEYKGQRAKDDLDWTTIFNEFENLIHDMHDLCGITYVHEPGVEGDDWCWYWSNILNNDGTNVLIWSADKDLTQLVRQHPETGVFTVTLYTRGSKTTITKEKLDEDNSPYMKCLLSPYFTQNQQLMNSIATHATDVIEVIPKHIVLNKILRGDVSDNIISPLMRITQSGKKYRISEKQLDYTINIYNEEEIREYVSRIYETKLFKGKANEPLDVAIEHILYNRKLVALDERSYPTEILESMKQKTEYNRTCDLSLVEQQQKARFDGMESMLNEMFG